ncbi:MAG: ATP-binding protein [Oscillospiraceae bacterium]|nr:ATP-binding protein [Oscillospiraceae bacterium]MCL2279272.1 ATP-binding protein [Oscillospiraceae bacterium]
MAIDGKILARARNALQARRRRKEEMLENRLREVYAKSQTVAEIDLRLRESMTRLLGVALGENSGAEIEDIRQTNIILQDNRRLEVVKAGFSKDYLDDNYMCERCKDTGFCDDKMCGCLEEIYRQEQSSSLSNLFKLGDERFENFSLQYYDDRPSSETGISPRKSMEIVYETCKEYAKKFGKNSMNLFFNGAPGLGKTYLSACIARVVAENGYSVVYDMATVIFAKFEDAKFSRTDNLEDTRNEIKRYMECDLLIMDDLGTEMTTVFTISALYEIINTRLVTGKKTIVNSNLTIAELQKRYSEQITSRLEGEYQVLTFYGEDIRKKRNAL